MTSKTNSINWEGEGKDKLRLKTKTAQPYWWLLRGYADEALSFTNTRSLLNNPTITNCAHLCGSCWCFPVKTGFSISEERWLIREISESNITYRDSKEWVDKRNENLNASQLACSVLKACPFESKKKQIEPTTMLKMKTVNTNFVKSIHNDRNNEHNENEEIIWHEAVFTKITCNGRYLSEDLNQNSYMHLISQKDTKSSKYSEKEPYKERMQDHSTSILTPNWNYNKLPGIKENWAWSKNSFSIFTSVLVSIISLFSLVSQVQAEVVLNIIYNGTDDLSRKFPGALIGGITSRYDNTTNNYLYVGWSKDLRIYDKDGLQVAKLTTNAVDWRSVNFLKVNQYIVEGSSSPSLNRYSFTRTSTTVSFNPDGTIPFSSDKGYSLQDKFSDFIYFTYVSDGYMKKMSSSTPVLFTGAFNYSDYGKQEPPFDYTSECLIVFFETNLVITIVKKTTLDPVFQMNVPNVTVGLCSDTVNSSCWMNFGQNKLADIDISTGVASEMVYNHPLLNLPDTTKNLVDTKAFGLLTLLSSSGKILVVEKLGMSLIFNEWCLTKPDTFQSLVGGYPITEPSGLKFYFMYAVHSDVSAGSLGFFSLGLNPDNGQCLVYNQSFPQKCIIWMKEYILVESETVASWTLKSNLIAGFGVDTVRNLKMPWADSDWTDWFDDYLVWKSCGSGSFLFTDTNSCLIESEFLSGFGSHPNKNSVLNCSDSTWINWRKKYMQCDEYGCDIHNGEYMNSDLMQWIPIDQISGKYGANLISGYMVPCLLPNWLLWQKNHLVWTKWDISSGYYLSSGTWITTTDMPNWYGPAPNGKVMRWNVNNWQNCSLNYLAWNKWSNSNPYYHFEPLYSKWIHENYIESGRGINITDGIIYACIEPYWTSWKYDNTIWGSCNTTLDYYYLIDTGKCILKSMIPNKYGPNLSSGKVSPCSVSNWFDWSDDYIIWKSWYSNTNLYYKYNDSWIQKSEILPKFGINSTSYTVTGCQDQFCVDWVSDFLIWKSCDVSQKYYLYGTNWINSTEFPIKYGINLTTGKVVICLTIGCLSCQADFLICTQWDSSLEYYIDLLHLAGIADWALKTNIPTGVGIDLIDGSVKYWAILNWDSCLDNYEICNSWAPNYYIDITVAKSDWKLKADIIDGKGISSIDNSIRFCASDNCSECLEDYRICTICKPSFKLDGVTKGWISIVAIQNIVIVPFSSINEQKSYVVDYSVLLQFKPSESISSDTALKVGSFIEENLTINIKMALRGSPSNYTKTTSEINFLKNNNIFVIDIMFLDEMAMETYNIDVYTESDNVYEISEASYELKAFSFSYTYYNPVGSDLFREGRLLGQSTSPLVSAPGGSSTVESLAIAIVSLEPSGILMKLAQLIKLYNRIYFVNINFGVKLEAFLDAIKNSDRFKNKESADHITMHSSSTRGRLSLESIPLEFVSVFFDLFPLYVISWLFQQLNFYTLQKFRVRKWYLYVMYYAPKVHLIIFNTVIMDFIFIGARSACQSRNLYEAQILSRFCLFLLTLDFISFTSKILDNNAWSKVYKRRRLMEEIDTSKLSLKTEDKNSRPLAKARIMRVIEPEIRRIDYKETYEELNLNYHLMGFLSLSLMASKEVFSSKICRASVLVHILRLVVYQVTIVTFQYLQVMCLICLVATELLRSGYSILIYTKMRYLRNKLLLAMEIAQSLVFWVFLLICSFMFYNRKQDEIPVSLQNFAIMFIIVSIWVTYLLLITHILTSIATIYRARKNKKVPSNFFIHYTDENEPLGVKKRKRKFNRSIGNEINYFERFKKCQINKINIENRNILDPMSKSVKATKNNEFFYQKDPTNLQGQNKIKKISNYSISSALKLKEPDTVVKHVNIKEPKITYVKSQKESSNELESLQEQSANNRFKKAIKFSISEKMVSKNNHPRLKPYRKEEIEKQSLLGLPLDNSNIDFAFNSTGTTFGNKVIKKGDFASSTKFADLHFPLSRINNLSNTSRKFFNKIQNKLTLKPVRFVRAKDIQKNSEK